MRALTEADVPEGPPVEGPFIVIRLSDKEEVMPGKERDEQRALRLLTGRDGLVRVGHGCAAGAYACVKV